MSVPRSLGWVCVPTPLRTRPPNFWRPKYIYQSRTRAIASKYADNYDLSWGLCTAHHSEIRGIRTAEVLTRYDIKEVFVHD